MHLQIMMIIDHVLMIYFSTDQEKRQRSQNKHKNNDNAIILAQTNNNLTIFSV